MRLCPSQRVDLGASEIAADIASSERTVRRDLSELQDAGIDIEITKRANRVFAYLTEERSYSSVSITSVSGSRYSPCAASSMCSLERRFSRTWSACCTSSNSG
jgi:hypothetical protein